MSKLQTTMEAMYEAMADVPAVPTAWVPLRRTTVEEALRLLGSVHGVLAPLKALAAELEGESPAMPVQALQLNGLATSLLVSNGNGHVTVQDGRKRPKADWSKLPKEERLAQVMRVIAELAKDGQLSMREFDEGRPAGMSTAGAQVVACGMTWVDLVKSALAPTEGKGAPADGGSTFRA